MANTKDLVEQLCRQDDISTYDVFRIADAAGLYGVKTWCDDDVRSVLEEDGYTPSDENVAIVCNTGFAKFLEECTDMDWETIHQAVESVRGKLEKMS